jgi:hypothetical protein
MENTIFLNNTLKYPKIYKLAKIPSFKFYYIDPSEISNTKALLNHIYEKLFNDSDSPFFIYISNGSNPYFTSDKTEWQLLIKKISDLNIEPPIISMDINQIKNMLDLNLISKRTKIEFNIFISKNSYKFSINSLLDVFKINTGEDRIINIYLDYDEENTLKNCKYFNINKK